MSGQAPPGCKPGVTGYNWCQATWRDRLTDRGPSRWSWLPGGLSVLLFGAALAGQAVLHEPVVRERAASLLEELQRVDAQQAGQLLDRLGDDPQLTAAQRDAVAMALVRRLRQMPPGRIDRTVVDHLAEWTPRAWRRHEESASLQVPLFNVAAATRGLINQWDWQAGAADIAGTGGPRSTRCWIGWRLDRTRHMREVSAKPCPG